MCIFELWAIEGDRYIITLTLSHIHYSRHLYSITADLLAAVKGDHISIKEIHKTGEDSGDTCMGIYLTGTNSI